MRKSIIGILFLGLVGWALKWGGFQLPYFGLNSKPNLGPNLASPHSSTPPQKNNALPVEEPKAELFTQPQKKLSRPLEAKIKMPPEAEPEQDTEHEAEGLQRRSASALEFQGAAQPALSPPDPRNKRNFLKKHGLRWPTPQLHQFQRRTTPHRDVLVMQHKNRDLKVRLHMLYDVHLFGVQQHLAIGFNVLDTDVRPVKVKWKLNPYFKPNKFFTYFNPSGNYSYWATRWRHNALMLEAHTLHYDRQLHNELIQLYQALRPL